MNMSAKKARLCCQLRFQRNCSGTNFYEALITEIGLPAVDAASKEACKFTIKMAPEWTEIKHSSGTQSMLPAPKDTEKQKRWQAANFRFVVDGMNTQRVNKVEALTIKQNVVDNAVGERLIFKRNPPRSTSPTSSSPSQKSTPSPSTSGMTTSSPRGKSDPANEKNGHLEYLKPDVAGVLFTVDFFGLGIIKFNPEKAGIFRGESSQ